MWILLRWSFKFPDWLLQYVHKWQANGFSPVCILLRWPFKFPAWLLRYVHKWQANGFSPVWILMWVCKLWTLLTRKLHKWQAKGFSICWNNFTIFFKHTFNISVSGKGMNFMNIKICQTVAGIIMMGQFPRNFSFIFLAYQKNVN